MNQIKLTDLKLIRPDVKYKKSFLDGFRELTSDSDRYAWVYLGESVILSLPENNFSEYVKILLSRETKPDPNFVCDTTYWALYEDQIVGRISLRHELNKFLKKVGGHIGYIVRPSYRGRGVASEMLRLILLTERAKNTGKLLLTCDENNTISERTIIKNGGIFESLVELSTERPNKKHFWINLR